jgi:hypothetical protein
LQQAQEAHVAAVVLAGVAEGAEIAVKVAEVAAVVFGCMKMRASGPALRRAAAPRVPIARRRSRVVFMVDRVF